MYILIKDYRGSNTYVLGMNEAQRYIGHLAAVAAYLVRIPASGEILIKKYLKKLLVAFDLGKKVYN